jgi:hypothetical protein
LSQYQAKEDLMRVMVSLFIVSATTFATAAFAAPLTGEQIKATISGKSAKWSSGKIGGTIGWKADGTQTVTGNFNGFSEDSGRWRIQGNKLCSSWKKIRNGSERCDTWESKGGKKYQSGSSAITMN